jgi:hypothetical protein
LVSRKNDRVLQARSALRLFVPPVSALFLAAMVGMTLGSAIPVSLLQQAASALVQLNSSVLSGL